MRRRSPTGIVFELLRGSDSNAMTVVVGICAAVEQARWGGWDETVALVPRSYASAVQKAGALAFVLPPDDAAAEAPEELLDRIDALILAGGSDVDPGSYGARPHGETKGARPERDRFELALAHGALQRGMPVLGICRGMQMLNVAAGGTIEQHLPERLGHSDHRHTPGTFSDHEVVLAPDSLAAQATGEQRASVKSHHHQGAGELGEGVEVTGWSDDEDRVVEAIELPRCDYALGVLWHLEEDERSRVVASLVQAARERAAAR